jgi:tetratricopeptide (TPR) repeat protein
MKRVVIAAVIVGVLIPIAARADLEEGAYAPDLDAPDWMNTDGKSLSIAGLRGMVVVLYFWESWHATGERLLPLMNQLDSHPALGRGGGVYTIGVTSADRVSVEETVKKEHIVFPIALGCKAAVAYKITQFPRVVIIDPMGKVVYSDFSNPNSMVKEILKLLEDSTPFRTHPREAAKARKYLQAARDALERGDYREAFLQATDANDHALMDDPLKARCQEMLDLVDAIGHDRLQHGLALIENHQFDQGVKVINEVLEQFHLAGCAKAARRHLRFLKDHYPEVQRAVEKTERAEQAHASLVKAAERLWRRKFGEAYAALEKVERDYADTKAAAIAKTIRDRIDANQSLAQRVRDEQAKSVCEERLARARSFIAARRYEEARKLLRSIIEEFPNTRYLEDAYQLLSEIP